MLIVAVIKLGGSMEDKDAAPLLSTKKRGVARKDQKEYGYVRDQMMRSAIALTAVAGCIWLGFTNPDRYAEGTMLALGAAIGGYFGVTQPK